MSVSNYKTSVIIQFTIKVCYTVHFNNSSLFEFLNHVCGVILSIILFIFLTNQSSGHVYRLGDKSSTIPPALCHLKMLN